MTSGSVHRRRRVVHDPEAWHLGGGVGASGGIVGVDGRAAGAISRSAESVSAGESRMSSVPALNARPSMPTRPPDDAAGQLDHSIGEALLGRSIDRRGGCRDAHRQAERAAGHRQGRQLLRQAAAAEAEARVHVRPPDLRGSGADPGEDLVDVGARPPRTAPRALVGQNDSEGARNAFAAFLMISAASTSTRRARPLERLVQGADAPRALSGSASGNRADDHPARMREVVDGGALPQELRVGEHARGRQPGARPRGACRRRAAVLRMTTTSCGPSRGGGSPSAAVEVAEVARPLVADRRPDAHAGRCRARRGGAPSTVRRPLASWPPGSHPEAVLADRGSFRARRDLEAVRRDLHQPDVAAQTGQPDGGHEADVPGANDGDRRSSGRCHRARGVAAGQAGPRPTAASVSAWLRRFGDAGRCRADAARRCRCRLWPCASRQYRIEGLGHLSTLVVHEAAGWPWSSTPRRDVDLYLAAAADEDLRITHVVETHSTTDYVSGGRELASLTGRHPRHRGRGGGPGIRTSPDLAIGAGSRRRGRSGSRSARHAGPRTPSIVAPRSCRGHEPGRDAEAGRPADRGSARWAALPAGPDLRAAANNASAPYAHAVATASSLRRHSCRTRTSLGSTTDPWRGLAVLDRDRPAALTVDDRLRAGCAADRRCGRWTIDARSRARCWPRPRPAIPALLQLLEERLALGRAGLPPRRDRPD